MRIRTTNPVRGECLVLAVAVFAALALGVGAGSAHATWPGSQNGRILLTNGFTRQVVSVCPDATSMVVHRSLALSPDASPDGKTFAFRGGPSDDPSTWGVWLRDFATGAETRISGPGGIVETGDEFDPDGRTLGFPRFSADGKRLAVQAAWTEQQQSGAYEGWGRPALVNLETGAYTLLDGSRDKSVRQSGAELAWSPDGTKIFFIGQRLVNGNYTGGSLFSVSTADGDPVLIDSSADYGSIDFSPDGTKLLAGTQAGLVEMGPDGGGGRVLASNGHSGVYSPDGKKIAYAVTDSSTGHSHLWTMDADGTDATDEGLHWIGLQPEAWSSNVDGCGADETYGGMRVNEVMIAKGSDPAAQFVELLGAADHPFPAADGPYGIAVFDAGNVRIAQHNLPADFLPGRDTAKEILISNAAADSALGATGDYHTDLPLSLPTSAGRVCFTAKNGESLVSCVAYGCFSPSSLPATDYAPLPPTEQSIQRQGVSSTIWRIASPTPKLANTAGSTGTNCIPPPGDGGGGDGGAGDGGGGSAGGAGTVTPPQLVDSSGPIFTVPPTNKRLRLTRSGVLRFAIGPAAENITGVMQFKTDKRIRLKRRGKKKVITFGTVSFQALKGQQIAATLKIAKRYRRYLEKARKLKMQVNITARDLAGNATIKSFNFTLQARGR